MSDTRTNELLLRLVRALKYVNGLLSDDRNELYAIENELMAIQNTGQFPQLTTRPQKPKKTGKHTGKGRGK